MSDKRFPDLPHHGIALSLQNPCRKKRIHEVLIDITTEAMPCPLPAGPFSNYETPFKTLSFYSVFFLRDVLSSSISDSYHPMVSLTIVPTVPVSRFGGSL